MFSDGKGLALEAFRVESVPSRLTLFRTRLSERWREARPDVRRLTSYQPGGASVLVDRNGKAFADLAPIEGELIPLARLPRYVPEAFIAIEDQRFREHDAIDLRRVLGALWNNLRAGGAYGGSSTLTTRLARSVGGEDVNGRRRRWVRKMLEVRVAQEIEDTFTK